ncbi:type III secretion system chaperone [Melaminivora sp.]
MSEDSVSALISALGAAIGIPGLRADAQGCCRLMFDGEHIVELHPAPAQGRWLLCCTLRAQQAGHEALRTLLQGNLMGAGFGGGWAALDAQGNAVLHLPLAWSDASADSLLQATELLLQHAERWQQRLSSAQHAAAPAARMMDWAQRI